MQHSNTALQYLSDKCFINAYIYPEIISECCTPCIPFTNKSAHQKNGIAAVLSLCQMKKRFTNVHEQRCFCYYGESRVGMIVDAGDRVNLLLTSQVNRQRKGRFSETMLLFLPVVIYLWKWVNLFVVDMLVCECLAALLTIFCPLHRQRNGCT